MKANESLTYEIKIKFTDNKNVSAGYLYWG